MSVAIQLITENNSYNTLRQYTTSSRELKASFTTTESQLDIINYTCSGKDKRSNEVLKDSVTNGSLEITIEQLE
jgi:hypothetical protein